MPHLDFIREFIRENEVSPRLGEIAERFGVKSPTAHNTLEALQRKGYIRFERSSQTGFYVRVAERAGSREVIYEVPVSGRINGAGVVYDFPELLGSFAEVVIGAEKDSVFALIISEDIPTADMLPGDLIIFDMIKKPQSGDICIMQFEESLLVIQIGSKTLDRDILSIETAIDFPIPEDLAHPESDPLLNWWPLAYGGPDDRWKEVVGEWEIALPPDFVLATALQLYRTPNLGP